MVRWSVPKQVIPAIGLDDAIECHGKGIRVHGGETACAVGERAKAVLREVHFLLQRLEAAERRARGLCGIRSRVIGGAGFRHLQQVACHADQSARIEREEVHVCVSGGADCILRRLCDLAAAWRIEDVGHRVVDALAEQQQRLPAAAHAIDEFREAFQRVQDTRRALPPFQVAGIE